MNRIVRGRFRRANDGDQSLVDPWQTANFNDPQLEVGVQCVLTEMYGAGYTVMSRGLYLIFIIVRLNHTTTNPFGVRIRTDNSPSEVRRWECTPSALGAHSWNFSSLVDCKNGEPIWIEWSEAPTLISQDTAGYDCSWLEILKVADLNYPFAPPILLP